MSKIKKLLNFDMSKSINEIKNFIENNIEIIEEEYCNLKALMWSSMYSIARNDDRSIEITKILISKGSDVNDFNKNRTETTLLCACETGDLDIVKFLIEKGANINIETENFENPLLRSLRFGNKNIFYYLIEKGANISYTCKNGNNCLFCACYFNELEVFNFLLNYDEIKKNINFKNIENGSTLLIIACEIDSFEIVKKLVEEGADINIVNNYGKKALDYASENKKILDFLNRALRSRIKSANK